MDDAAALRWNMRAQRSNLKRPLPPPPQLDADEYAAAESLILLANSAGGFCATAIATASPISSPKKHQEIPQSAGDTTPAAAIAKKQEAASPDTPLPPPLHQCWLCGRVFESSQALGGHMTSHRAKIVNGEDKGRRSAAAESRIRVHECSFCHQKFPTGQALGGHKRMHYDGPALLRKPAKCETSTSPKGIAGQTSAVAAAGHVRPIIDLNMPPPPELEL